MIIDKFIFELDWVMIIVDKLTLELGFSHDDGKFVFEFGSMCGYINVHITNPHKTESIFNVYHCDGISLYLVNLACTV